MGGKIRIRMQGAEKIQIQIKGAEINRSGSRERGKTQIWIQGAEKHGSGSRERRNPRKLIQGAENTILNSGSEKHHEERKKSRIWIQSAKEKQTWIHEVEKHWSVSGEWEKYWSKCMSGKREESEQYPKPWYKNCF